MFRRSSYGASADKMEKERQMKNGLEGVWIDDKDGRRSVRGCMSLHSAHGVEGFVSKRGGEKN